ncbi:MAG: ABC transporter permease subunit [Oscillospiraceae bacterium]|jgi:phosphonate transport system permease protein|nr:ABC transporter permease subunit [Oscillospiraceae bacterium]
MNQTNSAVRPGAAEIYRRPASRVGRTPVTDWRYGLPAKLFLAVSAGLTILSLGLLKLDWGKIAERTPKLGRVFLEMSRFSTEKFSLTITAMAETVTVSILALIYGLIIGIVLGALSARNITPFKPLAGILQGLLAFIRAVPTAVWVLLVLASMGFGMSAGIVGLLFHCAAFFGKVFAQIFEEVPDETIEAVRSTGAGRLQVFFGAVLPASLSGIIAWTALRFETNYVEAAILGMVGAGGIGYTMTAAMSSYKYGRAGLAVVIVFAFALMIELLTTLVKRKLKV